jgi:hypothetical protein
MRRERIFPDYSFITSLQNLTCDVTEKRLKSPMPLFQENEKELEMFTHNSVELGTASRH